MTRYVCSLLCVLSTAACSHDKPAQSPAETTSYEATTTTTTAPETTAPETAPVADTRLPPVSAEPSSNASDTPASARASDSNATGTSGTARTATSSTASTDYKTMNASVPPDNTRVNKRDTKSAAVTPLDQGESQADLDITKRIRQAVMGDHSLSFTAKNVKIVTQNGKVTLRGPVASNAERGAIEAAAEKVAGAGNVSNQIEVKK